MTGGGQELNNFNSNFDIYYKSVTGNPQYPVLLLLFPRSFNLFIIFFSFGQVCDRSLALLLVIKNETFETEVQLYTILLFAAISIIIKRK